MKSHICTWLGGGSSEHSLNTFDSADHWKHRVENLGVSQHLHHNWIIKHASELWVWLNNWLKEGVWGNQILNVFGVIKHLYCVLRHKNEKKLYSLDVLNEIGVIEIFAETVFVQISQRIDWFSARLGIFFLFFNFANTTDWAAIPNAFRLLFTFCLHLLKFNKMSDWRLLLSELNCHPQDRETSTHHYLSRPFLNNVWKEWNRKVPLQMSFCSVVAMLNFSANTFLRFATEELASTLTWWSLLACLIERLICFASIFFGNIFLDFILKLLLIDVSNESYSCFSKRKKE